jgi:hypothetical protein
MQFDGFNMRCYMKDLISMLNTTSKTYLPLYINYKNTSIVVAAGEHERFFFNLDKDMQWTWRGTIRSDVWRLKDGGPRSKESSGRGLVWFLICFDFIIFLLKFSHSRLVQLSNFHFFIFKVCLKMFSNHNWENFYFF